MRRPALFLITGLVVVSLAGNVLYQRTLQQTRERYRGIAQQILSLPAQVLAAPPAPALPSATEPALAPPPGEDGAPVADSATVREKAPPSAPADNAPASAAASAPAVTAPETGGAPESAARPAAGASAGVVAEKAVPQASPLEAIRVKYSPRMQEIQTDCETRLDKLLQEAKAEYDQQQATGHADLAVLFGKYGPEFDSLRRICDGRVDAMLGDLSADLKAADLPQDLVSEVRKAYQTRVAEMQAQILAKVQ